jgi:murein DD-endopeptidase MepM/ murein hydrolase activator NlpD
MNKLITLLLVSCLLLQVKPVIAQNANSDPPTYIVQSGDTLNSISYRLGVSPVDLADANGIQDANMLAVGEILIIPGLNGIHGLLTDETVSLGETLTSLSREYQIPMDILVQLNHITSPAELYAGASLFITQPAKEKAFNRDFTISTGQTLLEAAVTNNVSPWTVISNNQLPDSNAIIPGDKLFFTDPAATEPRTNLIPSIANISISPLPIVQGKTTEIEVNTTQTVTLSGSLGSRTLHFFQTKENQFVTLQGVYAMVDPGLYPIVLTSTLADGTVYSIDQMILLKPGYYPKDPPLVVDPKTIDPQFTQPEDKLVAGVTQPVTADKYWDGNFRDPVDKPICINSWFGNRRSYNGSPYTYFHTGLDYGVCANLFIYAPAAGVVVYTGSLTVRGNATIIDHGWGVYSGIWHQKEIRVKVGDHVEAGQIIGLIGDTGRVNGPHLHWEVWANGIQVDPQDWLDNAYPVLN